VEVYLRAINDLFCQLGNCGIQIADKELVNTVLISLPPSWAHFRTSVKLTNQGQALLFAKLSNYLIDEEMSRELPRVHLGPPETAYVISQQGILQTPTVPTYIHNRVGKGKAASRAFLPATSSPSPDTSTCHSCGLTGHWANKCECRKLENHIKSLQSRLLTFPVASVNVAAVGSTPDKNFPAVHQVNTVETVPYDASTMLRSYIASNPPGSTNALSSPSTTSWTVQGNVVTVCDA
jgi:hypothetical protein